MLETLNYLYQNYENYFILEFLKYALPYLKIIYIKECIIIYEICINLNIEISQKLYNYCMKNKDLVLSTFNRTRNNSFF
jgi:hypothetical protein